MCTQTNPEFDKLPLDVQKIVKENALKYMRYKDRLNDIPEKEIDLFWAEIEAAFRRIQRRDDMHGEYFIEFVDRDPYKNLEEMTEGIEMQHKLYISSLNNNSVLLPGEMNLKFRAVHDYLHYLLQQPFDYQGEYKVYQAQKHIHKSQLRRQILYSEIVLQAAFCTYFGYFPEKQKVVL